MRAKRIKFVIIIEQVIQTKETGTVFITLSAGSTIKQQNVALALECNLNDFF